MKPKKTTKRYGRKQSSPRLVAHPLSLGVIAIVAVASVGWIVLDDIYRRPEEDFPGAAGAVHSWRTSGSTGYDLQRRTRDEGEGRGGYGVRERRVVSSSRLNPASSEPEAPVMDGRVAYRRIGGSGVSEAASPVEFIKLPEARMDALLATAAARREQRIAGASRRNADLESPLDRLPPSARQKRRGSPAGSREKREAFPETDAFAMQSGYPDAGAGEDGLFTLKNMNRERQGGLDPVLLDPAPPASPTKKPRRGVAAISSENAYANPYGKPVDADDLFTLKLHAVYGSSKADFEDERLGKFKDRFLVLGGEKKLEFAGMDEMKFAFDGVITTSGTWDREWDGRWGTDSLEQNLSGFTLNAGPEIKLPELPIKFDANLGVGWLKRDATLLDNSVPIARTDIDSFVYGGGISMRGDWQWRMLNLSGLVGVQYAAANEKSHYYKDIYDESIHFDPKIPKTTFSSWEVPLQLRAGGEYRLLDALTISPAIWGGYTYNVTGKNGPFHSGHLAGAEGTWRRNGMTWNKSSWHAGAEVRINLVDRINLWFDYQKEWAGGDSGSYCGGGLQIAF